MTDDLETGLRALFADDRRLEVAAPAAAARVLARVRRRRRQRVVAGTTTAIAAASVAGVLVAAGPGGQGRDRTVIPATPPGSDFCPEYAYRDSPDQGVSRLMTLHPTPVAPDMPPGTEYVPPEEGPWPSVSTGAEPLPTDRPVPPTPDGCRELPEGWEYVAPSPEP